VELGPEATTFVILTLVKVDTGAGILGGEEVGITPATRNREKMSHSAIHPAAQRGGGVRHLPRKNNIRVATRTVSRDANKVDRLFTLEKIIGLLFGCLKAGDFLLRKRSLPLPRFRAGSTKPSLEFPATKSILAFEPKYYRLKVECPLLASRFIMLKASARQTVLFKYFNFIVTVI
jgi:hypothetical protein